MWKDLNQIERIATEVMREAYAAGIQSAIRHGLVPESVGIGTIVGEPVYRLHKPGFREQGDIIQRAAALVDDLREAGVITDRYYYEYDTGEDSATLDDHIIRLAAESMRWHWQAEAREAVAAIAEDMAGLSWEAVAIRARDIAGIRGIPYEDAHYAARREIWGGAE